MVSANILEVLEFYANEDNWPSNVALGPNSPLVDRDQGEKARELLEQIKMMDKITSALTKIEQEEKTAFIARPTKGKIEP